MWLKAQLVGLLFLLLLLILVLFLFVILIIFIVFILILVNLFYLFLFFSIIIIYSSPSRSLCFYSLFYLICDHHIILFLNTLQPRILILVSSLKHKITLLINITHILLFSHIKRLNYIAKILHLWLNIFFLILVAIYIQSLL